MNEPAEHRVRLHGKSGPPPWQRRSRWFPHIDAADGLVMSSVLLVVLLGGCLMGVVASASTNSGARPHTFLVVAGETGFEAVDTDWALQNAASPTVVGSLMCGTWKSSRGWFGPAAIVERPLPFARVILHDTNQSLSSEEAERIAASAAKLTSRFQPTSLTRVRARGSGIVELEYAPGPPKILWSGIAANFGLWCYFALVCWTFAWLVHSLHYFLDPRRKRARKLGVHLCPRCDYDVRLIESPRCPECGERLTIEPEHSGSAPAK